MAIPNGYGHNDWKNPAEDDKNGGDLAAWVMKRVEYAREQRDGKYKDRWDEYTRLWRGFFTDKDKNTDSERSRLIAPALQQAIDMTVSEMEEAVFGRAAWFDITDDIADENRDDAVQYRDQLLEDFELDGVAAAISQIMLLGSIYGTGIGKLNVLRKQEKSLVDGKEVIRERVAVEVVPVRPDEFVIDTAATSVDSAFFVAHEMVRPRHSIKEKQLNGLYRNTSVGPWSGVRADPYGTGRDTSVSPQDDAVLITEYFGKVPASMLPEARGTGMVEAIVTVANEGILLRAKESPFTMKDRPIVAYQHSTVPGEFWGRGVSEMGYNPQKALDAELRARIDALALITAPMIGADITRLPRNPDTRVRPGKTLFTRGRPSEVYEQLSLANPAILAHTFQHSGDLERMVQMGTGAMDSATPVGVNARNETASGLSQLQSGFIKRSKRTMQNLERQFLDPLIRRSLWRYMQFDTARYPVDMKFVVNGTMGIMAKEVETTQLTNMLGYLTPDDGAARKIIINALFENSTSANKSDLKRAIAALSAPPTPEEEQEQAQMKRIQMEIALTQAQEARARAEKESALAQKALADTELAKAKTYHEYIEAELEDDLVNIQAANAVTGAERVRSGDRANIVAADRNMIEAKKAMKEGKKNGSDSGGSSQNTT